IGYVESGYPHPHGGGGAGTYVRLVGRELVRRGHSVTVIASWCPQCPVQESDEGVCVHRPKPAGGLHWYASKLPLIRELALSLRYLEQGWRIYRALNSIHKARPLSIVEFSEGGDFWHAFRRPFPVVSHLHGSRFTFLKQSGRPINGGDRLERRLELT